MHPTLIAIALVVSACTVDAPDGGTELPADSLYSPIGPPSATRTVDGAWEFVGPWDMYYPVPATPVIDGFRWEVDKSVFGTLRASLLKFCAGGVIGIVRHGGVVQVASGHPVVVEQRGIAYTTSEDCSYVLAVSDSDVGDTFSDATIY